jgi:RNA polymerase sigma-70 factor (ECF subfamily)
MDREVVQPEERLMGEVNGHTAVLGRWLERLRGGDEAARSEVINHACVRLEALTRRMLRHYPRLRRWEQTGDVLQNAVLRLHRSLATVRPESPAPVEIATRLGGQERVSACCRDLAPAQGVAVEN